MKNELDNMKSLFDEFVEKAEKIVEKQKPLTLGDLPVGTVFINGNSGNKFIKINSTGDRTRTIKAVYLDHREFIGETVDILNTVNNFEVVE